MSHYLNNLLPDTEIVTQRSKHSASKSRNINHEQAHTHSLFHSTNRYRGKDGRTYDRIDSDGNYISLFISQYSGYINNNIEPGVYHLVKSLHAKGYWTVGSCQGHSDSKSRWVMMAFESSEALTKFKGEVDSYNLPVTWYENFMNYKESPKKPDGDGYQVSFTWEQKQSYDRTLDQLRFQGCTEEEWTKFLNIMFNNELPRYYMTMMMVASKVNPSIIEIPKWWWNYKNRNAITKELTRLISNKLEYR